MNTVVRARSRPAQEALTGRGRFSRMGALLVDVRALRIEGGARVSPEPDAGCDVGGAPAAERPASARAGSKRRL